MTPLNQSTVLITGAVGGIGSACVRAFAAAGAKVAMTDVDAPAAATAGRQLAGEFDPARVRFFAADLRDEGAVRGLIESVVAAFGTLDVLVNNAAVIPPMKPVHETTPEEFDLLVSVNLRGAFLCCKHAHAHLARRGGAIVNVSSMAGVHGEKSHAAYAATKGGLNALTQAMAIDYGPEGIRCNAVCPSSVLTPTTDRMIAEAPDPAKIVAHRKAFNHLGYIATPQEIAGVVVFLASPAASFMTGAVVPVSGGTECGYGLK